MGLRTIVLDADSNAGLETVQSLGRGGVQVDVSSPDECIAFSSKYITGKHRQADVTQHVTFTSWLRKLDSQYQYSLVVPSTERSLLAMRQMAPDDPLRLKAVLPSDEALDTALNKQRTWKMANTLGIPVPGCTVINSLDNLPTATRYPVILKTNKSLLVSQNALVPGSVALIKHPEARLDFLRRYLPYGPVQEQTWVPGHGLGIEFLYRHGEEVWHFAHERVHEGYLWGGASSYRRSIAPPKDIFRSAKRLLDALKWHGVGMVEFRVDQNGQFFLMEINPRLWGSLAVAIDAGVDFPMGLLRIAANQTLPPQPSYRKHYYTRNILDDIPWQLANLRADRTDPTLRTRNPVLALFEFLRPLMGRESWDFFDWRDLAVTTLQVRQTVTRISKTVTNRWRRRKLARHLILQHGRRFGHRSQRTQIKNILFVCYGNICRSPFAEEAGRPKLGQYCVQSAGLDSRNDARQTPGEIVEVARLKGIDLSRHRSTPVTGERVRWADLVLVMDLDNYALLVREWPEAASRTTMLGLFASPPSLSISDPYGVPAAEASQIFDTIQASLSGLESWLSVVVSEKHDSST